MKNALFFGFLCLVVASCQHQPLEAHFIKTLDKNNKTIAMPLYTEKTPDKVVEFKEHLRAAGWKLMVGGVSVANNGVVHNNAAAKYTLLGEVKTTDVSPITLLMGGGAAYWLLKEDDKVHLTLVESSTGEEVMIINGQEKNWKPWFTVEQMMNHTR